MEELELKQQLLGLYGRFEDRRIRKLTTGQTFIVDDRKKTDFDHHGNPFSSLCMITASVKDGATVDVALRQNVPLNDGVKKWANDVGARLTLEGKPSIGFTVTPSTVNRLGELAGLFQGIVQRGAPAYDVRSYKYACPRSAKSLRRLEKKLKHCWRSEEPGAD